MAHRRGRPFLSTGLRVQLTQEVLEALTRDSGKDLPAHFVRPCDPPTLCLEDYPRNREDIEILVRILVNRTPGVNILVTGPPSLARNDFPRLLARQTGHKLYEVISVDSGGRPLPVHRRLGACKLGQCLLAEADCIFLFEVPYNPYHEGYNASVRSIVSMQEASRRLTTESLLEDNPVPVIWVYTDPESVESSFLSKFDYIVEVAKMTPDVRKRVLQSHLQGLDLSDSFLERLSLSEDIKIPDLERAVHLARLARCTSRADTESITLRYLENALKARGLSIPSTTRQLGVAGYSLEYINSPSNIPLLISQLTRTPSPHGTILLFGPPGTGKTAMAHHVSRCTGVKLIAKRASDLFGMYIGQNEQNIASMFQEARSQDAMLLLDEADSFLRERSNATFRWEVTDVNELLTNMESFEGLFICATNLYDDLDQACYRRFDLKVRFDYLTPSQAWNLFTAMCEDMDIQPPSQLRPPLDSLRNLTPGDFSTVRRQFEILSSTPTASEILDLLRHECRSKRDGQDSRAGFARS